MLKLLYLIRAKKSTFFIFNPPVVKFLPPSREVFTPLFRTQTPWLRHSRFPKYYKVFINKKKYKAHARASVLFLNIQNKSNKTKANKKGKFLTKFPKFIFKGQAPFSLSRKFPQVQKRAKRKTKRGIQVFDCQF